MKSKVELMEGTRYPCACKSRWHHIIIIIIIIMTILDVLYVSHKETARLLNFSAFLWSLVSLV